MKIIIVNVYYHTSFERHSFERVSGAPLRDDSRDKLWGKNDERKRNEIRKKKNLELHSHTTNTNSHLRIFIE